MIEQAIVAVLEWRKAKRQHAKLGSSNYFNRTSESERLFKESSQHLRKLAERMNELLDQYEGV